MNAGQEDEWEPVVRTFWRLCSIAAAFSFSLSFSTFLFAIFFLLFSNPAQMPPDRIRPKKNPSKIPLEVMVVVKYMLKSPTDT